MGGHIFKTQRSSTSRKGHAQQCVGVFCKGRSQGPRHCLSPLWLTVPLQAQWDKFLCCMYSQLAQGNSISKYEPYFFYQQGAKSFELLNFDIHRLVTFRPLIVQNLFTSQTPFRRVMYQPNSMQLYKAELSAGSILGARCSQVDCTTQGRIFQKSELF